MTELRWSARDLASKMPANTKTYVRGLFVGPRICVDEPGKLRALNVMGNMRTVVWTPITEPEVPIDP